jgi:hypothetical protein
MKMWMVWIIIAGLACANVQAAELGIFGSYWTPKDGDETFGAGAKVKGGLGPFYLSLRGTYFNDITEDVGDDVELRVIPLDAGVGLQLDLIDVIEIYGGVGATYYFMDIDGASIDDEIGWYLEAGVELTITKHASVFGEAVWRHVEGTIKDRDIDRSRVDVNLEGLGFNVGIVFR